MEPVTEHHPTKAATGHRHDYLPAAGRDAFLPFYDLFTGEPWSFDCASLA